MSFPADVVVVWFKRDLRLRDHEALAQALRQPYPVLLLHCFEPCSVHHSHHSPRHWQFVADSVADLNQQLKAHQTQVLAPYCDAREAFERIASKCHIHAVYSLQETGLKVTYDRDKALKQWFAKHEICWHEYQSNGVLRGLRNRTNWAKRWHKYMLAPQQPFSPQPGDFVRAEAITALADSLPRWEPLEDAHSANYQRGGETLAHEVLHDFLSKRAANYSKYISKPLQSREGCSRLSPYLAWGNISIRQVFQASRATRQQGNFRGPLQNFESRLRWHCHFIQKFEAEERMELESVNRGYALLVKPIRANLLAAWKWGRTGYPLVDACMRCLNQTGYINFRMRAMLTSFATHHLWQPWQAIAAHLAQQFLDFEPGIHFPQLQMQAGVTGTNTVRMYNPVKQAQDHDPEGVFVRQWVPELQQCPDAYLFEPWKMPPLEQEFSNFRIGVDYPAPIVELTESARHARQAIWSHRKNELVQQEKIRILQTHVVPGPRQA